MQTTAIATWPCDTRRLSIHEHTLSWRALRYGELVTSGFSCSVAIAFGPAAHMRHCYALWTRHYEHGSHGKL